MERLPGLEVFLLGILGALAPESLRIYSLRTHPEKFRWSWNYYLLSLPFWIVSGVIALILPAVTTWGAFYAGLSAPVLITTAIKQGTTAMKKRRGGLRELQATDQRSGIDAFVNAL